MEFYRHVLVMQLKLLCVCAAAFGQVPVVGLLANLVFVPTFALTYLAAWGGLLLASGGPGSVLVELQRTFLDLVVTVAELSQSAGMFIHVLDAGHWGAVVAAVAAIWALAGAVRSITT